MATGTLTEEVIEQVAEHLEETAQATRMLDARAIGFSLTGITIGAIVGFVFGYRFNKEKIRAEAFARSEEELEEIRESYRSRVTELPLPVPEKPELEEIIQERGYGGHGPAVKITTQDETVDLDLPRERLTEDEATDLDLSERPLKAPVPIDPNKRVFRSAEGEKDKNENWSYPHEMTQRSPDRPFIIHQDEFSSNETGYSQVTYTYFEGDGVLTENDDPITNIDIIVGLGNLKRFGHGSDDINILFIRNSELELEMEICRSAGSYEQEVVGLEHSETFERMRRPSRGFDDDDPN